MKSTLLSQLVVVFHINEVQAKKIIILMEAGYSFHQAKNRIVK